MLTRQGELSTDPDRDQALGRAGLTCEPRTNPAKIATIGYCFNATPVLELTQDGIDLTAVVDFPPA